MRSFNVKIFFLQSGFVLYVPYCTGRRTVASRADILGFYAHRAWRLLPLYYIVVLVTMSLHAANPVGSHAWYLEFAALLSTLFTFSAHGFLPPSNVVLWSVSVEIWFSALFPFFVLAVRRWPIAGVVIATTAACLVFSYIGKQIPIERVGQFAPFTSGLFATCKEFLFGMLVCHCYVAGLGDPALRARHACLLWPGFAFMLVAFYLIWRGAFFASAINYRALLFTVGFSMFLLGVISGTSPMRWLLQTWPLQVVGCMCYSIYAWHGIMMNEMMPPETSLLADTMRLLLPYLAVTFALSALSYRYIEFGRERNWKALFLIPERSVAVDARAVGNSPLSK